MTPCEITPVEAILLKAAGRAIVTELSAEQCYDHVFAIISGPDVTIGHRLNDRPTLVYGLAHFGKSLFWYTSELLFAYYLSEVCNLPPRAMGLVLALGFALGAVADILIGRGLTGLLRRAGQAGRFQLVGALLSAVTLLLIFLDAFLPQADRLANAIVTGLLFRVAYACYDLPQNVLISLGTGDPDSRSRVSGLRIFFSGAATLLISATTTAILALDISVKPIRFLAAAIVWCVIAIGSSWRLSRLSWDGEREAPAPPAGARHAGPAWSSAVSPQALFLLAMAFVVSATTSSFNKIEPYYTSYVLRDPVWGGVVLALAGIGSVISQPLWIWLSLRVSRRAMFGMCAGSVVFASLAFWATCRVPALAVAIAFLFGAASGGFGTTLWAAYGDAVKAADKGEPGLAFGLLTATIKLALAISVLAIGEGLSLFDYRALQSDLLMVLMCLVPAAGACFVALMTLRPRDGRSLMRLSEKHFL